MDFWWSDMVALLMNRCVMFPTVGLLLGPPVGLTTVRWPTWRGPTPSTTRPNVDLQRHRPPPPEDRDDQHAGDDHQVPTAATEAQPRLADGVGHMGEREELGDLTHGGAHRCGRRAAA